MPLNTDAFWEMVSYANWPENCHKDTGIIATGLYEQYGWEQCVQFAQELRESRHALQRVIEYHESEHGKVRDCGDDGFQDMLYEVIGRGKQFYWNILGDPTIIGDIDVHESFGYVSHPFNEREYSMFDNSFIGEHHMDRAYKALGHLYAMIIESKDHDKDARKNIEQRLYLLTQGEVEAACGDVNHELYNQLTWWDGNPFCALGANVLLDAKRYLLGRDQKNNMFVPGF